MSRRDGYLPATKRAGPWRSGFCGLDLPTESHRRCHGSYVGRPCICECHQENTMPTTTAEPQGLTVYRDLEQRSEEWYKVRRGILTASVVGKMITVGAPDALTVECPACHAAADSPCLSMTRKAPTPIKTPHDGRCAAAADLPPVIGVARNDVSRGITTSLVAERITGRTEETFVTDDMWRGIEHEPYARDVYSGHYQQAVECGFMVREEPMPWDPNEVVRAVDEDVPNWRLGYSPDGLVADDGLIEVKCPRAKGHVATILADEVPAGYMGQCQAALLVSGRKWLDYVSFCAGLPLFVKRVLPDPAWQEAIKAACIQFETTATEWVAAYTEATEGLPATERIEMEIVI